MNGLAQKFMNAVEYLSDAIARIFTPNKDNFPATGAIALATVGATRTEQDFEAHVRNLIAQSPDAVKCSDLQY